MTDNFSFPKIDIYADGADAEKIIALDQNPLIQGFTTNPSLMKKSGVSHYLDFAKSLLAKVKKPISFEIFADDENGMIEQGLILKNLAPHVYVKVPVINTKGEFTGKVIEQLNNHGAALNITAIFTPEQVKAILAILPKKTANPAHTILSIFGGRIADTGRDPMPYVETSAQLIKASQCHAALLWAGTRQVFSMVEAATAGCDIITMPYDMIDKFTLLGRDLTQCSKDAVLNFYHDALSSKLSLS